MPQELIAQLAPGGRMVTHSYIQRYINIIYYQVIPVGAFYQDFLVVDKDKDGNVTERAVLDVVKSRYIST